METKVIGIAGTAKNTGKTTTTNVIMEQIQRRKLNLGLTSIGYDGEDLDNVTGLPKPKIEVWPGVLVAAAEKCLEVSDAKIDVFEVTDISTPLGKIILGKVFRGGRLVVAGPNKSSELKKVLSKLRRYNLDFILVDGALNRIAPMVEVNGLILTTGAARKSKIIDLAHETHCIVEIFNTELIQEQGWFERIGSILNTHAVEDLISKMRHEDTVEIEGIIGEKSFSYLSKRISQLSDLKKKKIIFQDPIKILVMGNAITTHKIINELSSNGINLRVKKRSNIICVTVNPYYPKFRFNSEDYEEAFVDKDALRKAIEKSVTVNVYNVMEDGGEKIFEEILKE